MRWKLPPRPSYRVSEPDSDRGTIEKGWLGVDMYFSHFSARKNRRLVEDAGMVVDSAEVLAEPEDRCDARFLWIVAHRP